MPTSTPDCSARRTAVRARTSSFLRRARCRSQRRRLGPRPDGRLSRVS
jgi:hypothetical protein